MISELRQKSQITIPKDIVKALNLSEGDKLDISIEDGVIVITPIVVYSKSYIESLRNEIDDIKMKVASGEQPIFETIDAMFEELNKE